MHRRLLGVVPVGILLIATSAVAGCGSSSSTTTSTAMATISKAEFVAKGNAICAAGNKSQEAALNAFFKAHAANQKPTKAQEAQAVETILAPSVKAQISAVENIGSPSGQEQQVKTALESSKAALKTVEANPEEAFSKQDPFHTAGTQLHALGLTKCAPNS
jgi:hypothetical protein